MHPLVLIHYSDAPGVSKTRGGTIALTMGGEVLVDEAPCLEWSAAEEMISSVKTGAEALQVEIKAVERELELRDEKGRLLVTAERLHLVDGLDRLVLESPDGELVLELRAGQWRDREGQALGELSVRCQPPRPKAAPGPRQRPSSLAESLAGRLTST